MTTYIGFAISDEMFPRVCSIKKSSLSTSEATLLIEAETSIVAADLGHQVAIAALLDRYGIEVTIPLTAAVPALETGDAIAVISVRGLPRLLDVRGYDAAKVANSFFEFTLYEVK